MFRDDKQINRCCMLLCARLPALRRLWTVHGPTVEASRHLTQSRFSSGEQTMLRVAFDFYNGGGRVPLRDVIDKLDEKHRRCIAELILAETRGPENVDRWYRTWEFVP